MSIRTITIVGMGALGAMYGDFLTGKLGKERVEFVADKKRIRAFNAEGLFCNGRPCDFSIADEEERGRPADLLLFAVKGTGLEGAIRTARNKVSPHTIILSLLNGISSEEIIGKAYGADRVIPCVVQGMDATRVHNSVTYSQFGHFCIGADRADKRDKLRDVLELFDKVEMPYVVEQDIMRRLWSKFMLNVGVNQAVMIHEGTYETVQKPGGARDLMQSAMKEVMALAQKERIHITREDFDGYVALIDRMNPKGMPSMRQDGLARRKSEVELFAGTVLALADKHGVDAPVNRTIYETIREMERSY